jgi:hypothetical protein
MHEVEKTTKNENTRGQAVVGRAYSATCSVMLEFEGMYLTLDPGKWQYFRTNRCLADIHVWLHMMRRLSGDGETKRWDRFGNGACQSGQRMASIFDLLA